MLLNIPVQDLLASQLDITLGPVDGRLSCKLKPNVHNSYGSGSPPKSYAGITINLESVRGENGYILSLFASPDENGTPSTVPDDSALFAGPPECTMHDFSHIRPTEIDNNALSFLLSESSPPPDYFSDGSYEQSPASNSSGYSSLLDKSDLEHHFDFDFASGGMSTDMSGNSDFDSHQFSQFMGIAPNDALTYSGSCSSSSSDCGVAGPSRLPSPRPSFQCGAPSPASDSQSVASPPIPSTSTSLSLDPSTPACNSDSPCAHGTFITTAPPTPAPSEVELPMESGRGKTGRRAQYPCLHPTCERVLTSPYTRQVHMNTHRAKVRKAYICTLGCGEAFTRQHDRQRHEVALHGKKCKHVCTRCKRFFSSAKMLDRHVCRGHRHGSIQWPLGDEEAQDDTRLPEVS